MRSKKTFAAKFASLALAAIIICSTFAMNSFAADTLKAGTYEVDATLSCYVNAMGGVEFSDGYGLLRGAVVDVESDGSAKITLNLGTTSGLAVYGVDCIAFIGTDEAPGYYENGAIKTAEYTVSSKKVTNANGEVNYVDSVTFPVSKDTDEYMLWLYLDSNVMGCQLGDGSGTGSSNMPGVATAHTATLTVDWSSMPTEEETEATTAESSTQTTAADETESEAVTTEIATTEAVTEEITVEKETTAEAQESKEEEPAEDAEEDETESKKEAESDSDDVSETEETTVTETEITAENSTASAEIADTGSSAMSISVFATLSIATAAAYICTKKKN